MPWSQKLTQTMIALILIITIGALLIATGIIFYGVYLLLQKEHNNKSKGNAIWMIIGGICLATVFTPNAFSLLDWLGWDVGNFKYSIWANITAFKEFISIGGWPIFVLLIFVLLFSVILIRKRRARDKDALRN